MLEILKRVRSRLAAGFLLERSLWAAIVATAALLAHVILRKKAGIEWPMAGTLALVLIPAIAWLSRELLRRGPDLTAAARAVDRALATRDRFASALHCHAAALDSPFALRLRAEVEELCPRVKPAQAAPIALSPRWFIPAALAVAAYLAFAYLPDAPKPLMLTPEESTEAEKTVELLEQHAKDIEKDAGKDKELEELAKKLARDAAALRKNLDSKDKVLSDMDRLARELGEKKSAMEKENDLLRENLARGLDEAGRADAAAALRAGESEAALKELAEQMAKSALSEEQRKALAKSLEKAAERSPGAAGEALRSAAEHLKNGRMSEAAAEMAKVAALSGARSRAQAKLTELSKNVRFARNAIKRMGSGKEPKYWIVKDSVTIKGGGECKNPSDTGIAIAVKSKGACANPKLGACNEAGFGTTKDPYGDVYAPNLIKEDGKDALTPDRGDGPTIDEGLAPTLSEPVLGKSEAGLSRAQVEQYRRAATEAMEQEEIPDAYRDSIRDYFNRVAPR